MKIGIVGAGNIGGTLATALGRAGHEVTVGVRSPEGRHVEAAAVGPIADALRDVEVVLLALPGPAVEGFLRDHGADLDGVVVIDAANSIGGPGPLHHAEAFAQQAPGALMVRAFNNLGWENFAEPGFDGERADLYWCGPEGRASDVAAQVVADVGLRPLRVGGPEQIDVVDSVLPLWFALMRAQGHQRHLAFETLGV
jgi:predicted dinucleotide-binding enzyme